MRACSSAVRNATVALAALLAGSVGVTSLVVAQEAAPTSPAATIVTAATEPAAPVATEKPAPTAAADDADDPDLPATSTGPAPSDYKDEPAAKDEPATAPAATLRPDDPRAAALFDRLADAKPLLPRLPANQREPMKAFYATRDFKPLWIADNGLTPAAKSLIERLRAAGEDGLDANAYPIPTVGNGDAEIAEADLKLSAAALLYARDARGGRVNLAAISKLVTPDLSLPSADKLLPALAEAGESAGTKLQSYNPQSPGYVALRNRLAELRGPAPALVASNEPTGTLRLPVGAVLKVGMSDPRVPKLREFFSLPERAAGTLDSGPGEPEIYDQAVADAVSGFQRSRGLPANGHLTRSTLVALALPQQSQTARRDRGGADEAELIVNMERWRWLPGELGADYVLVNIPEFRLRVFRSGEMRDETRVIVGKTESPTPLFSGLIQYAVVNPSWYVPPSILKTMKGTNGFEVVGRGKNIGLRQPPGPKNALGYIKFLFPNRHSVYLHDTPNRSLFSASARAMSHGCVRVDDPFRFADAIMPQEWTAARLKKLVGHGERTITLPEKLPVHLGYFTAYIDDNGTYRTLPDLYGYDAKMKAQLGLTTTPAAVAARPVEPKRMVAEPVPYPAGAQQAKRTVATRAPAVRPVPQAVRPVAQTAQRVQRRAPDYVYGDRGLWTPQLGQPQPSRGWW